MTLHYISKHLDQAKSLLNKADEQNLRYACLELRFCLELVAYRQLEQYKNEIPGNLVKAWKADHIISVLASFDPTSDKTGKLSFGVPLPDGGMPETWNELGQTETISWKKFRAYYNKLGSFLHAPRDKSPTKLSTSSLSEIIAELDRVNSATIILALKIIRTATCPSCESKVFVGEEEFSEPGLVVCGNTQCNSLFHKSITDAGEKVLQPVNVLSFTCDCGARIPVPLDSIWKPFACRDCFKRYRVDLAKTLISPI